VLALLAACSSGTPAASGLPPCHPASLLNVGDNLPDCEFRAFDGSVLKLTSLRGHPAVLNFWASWCVECIQEMPAFTKAHNALGSAASIVGFNEEGVEGETATSARRFARQRGADYPLAFDPGGLLYSHFSENGSVRPLLPTTILVDSTGTVVFRRFGAYDFNGLLAEIHTELRV
jgi:peroxiredoxin